MEVIDFSLLFGFVAVDVYAIFSSFCHWIYKEQAEMYNLFGETDAY